MRYYSTPVNQFTVEYWAGAYHAFRKGKILASGENPREVSNKMGRLIYDTRKDAREAMESDMKNPRMEFKRNDGYNL